MTTIENWVGPGSGSPNTAPNSCWVDVGGTTGANWQSQVQFFNSSGGLVTVNIIYGVELVATGGVYFSNTLNGVNTATFNINLNNANTTYAWFVDYQGGTSCDHLIFSSTVQPGAGSSEHPMFKVRRSGIWIPVHGHNFRLRRSGVWIAISQLHPCSYEARTGGVYVRRSNAWTTRTSPW